MSHVLDKNRRDFNLTSPMIKEALPSYYAKEYGEDSGSLIKLLELYYQFLDSSGPNSFGGELNRLYSARDISEASTLGLDQLVGEIGNGLTASSFFQQPRLMARLLAQFYRAKGTLVSAEGFFRGFFNEEVNIEYPKDELFIVGESNIGSEDQKFIQDNAIFQVFSILVKSGISAATYQNLYKRFVHPAGFHFAGQLSTSGSVNVGVAAGTGINPLEVLDTDLILSSEGIIQTIASPSPLTAFLDGDSAQAIRVDQPLSTFQDIELRTLGQDSSNGAGIYQSLRALMTPNSFTFDDSHGRGSLKDSNLASGPDFSLTVETMDNAMFDSYNTEQLLI